MQTTKHQLADYVLGEPLGDYVARKRTDGESWRRISQLLFAETNGRIDVTHETLRAWFPEVGQP